MMIDNHNLNSIRSFRSQNCYLCGNSGNLLYKDLVDRLFEAPGNWNLTKCQNKSCELVWLDPMPIEEDISLAYKNYYTHHLGNSFVKSKGAKNFIRAKLRQIYRTSFQWTPIYRERKKRNLMYLNKYKPGKLLEVGCGDGLRLSELRDLGWKVEGQEVDPKSAKYASKNYGIKVHLNKLDAIGFPQDTFDVIILNHVIEHVYDPVALLIECYRILKVGGILIAITPNFESFGHKYFAEFWVHLDPPRHLHLFSLKTLTMVAKRAGFLENKVWTTSVYSGGGFLGSREIQKKGKFSLNEIPTWLMEFQAVIFQQLAWLIHLYFHNSGDEIVLKAKKGIGV